MTDARTNDVLDPTTATIEQCAVVAHTIFHLQRHGVPFAGGERTHQWEVSGVSPASLAFIRPSKVLARMPDASHDEILAAVGRKHDFDDQVDAFIGQLGLHTKIHRELTKDGMTAHADSVQELAGALNAILRGQSAGRIVARQAVEALGEQQLGG